MMKRSSSRSTQSSSPRQGSAHSPYLRPDGPVPSSPLNKSTSSLSSSASSSSATLVSTASGIGSHSAFGSRADPEDFYVRQNMIGKGSFGQVFKGYDKRTGTPVAIKIIDLENAEDEIDDIQLEIQILSQLNSEFVTRYHGSFLKGTSLWIIMEYCAGGSCSDLLIAGPFREDYIAIVLRELLRGLEYLHAQGKLHRDIKAANVLLSSTGSVKLGDFGVSGQLSATVAKKNTFGMSPEVIKQSGYDAKADIWSLGITAIEMANGEPPYSDLHPMKVLFLIPKNPPPELDARKFTKPFCDFVSLCLKRDPRERPSAKDLLKHRFIKNAKRTAYLTELIERHEQWKMDATDRSEDDVHQKSSGEEDVALEDLWDFGTIKNVRHPTVRSTRSVQRPVAPHSPTVQGPVTAQANKVNVNGVVTRDFANAQEEAASKPNYASHQQHYTSEDDGFSTVRHANGPPPRAAVSNRTPSGPRPIHNPPTPSQLVHQQQTNGHRGKQPSDDSFDETEPDHAESILEGVVLPVLDSIAGRIVNGRARSQLYKFRRALEEAEREIPGLMNVFVADIVDSVERVGDPDYD